MSDKMKNQKKAEAEASMKEADKLTTKTLLRWKCDWDTGIILYEKAANGFRVAKLYSQAKYCYKRLSLCQVNCDVYYLAAKSLEMASTMAKELGENEDSKKLLLEAVQLYRTNGNSFAAADTMTKAAKIIESTDLNECIRLLKDACELFELDDKDHFSGETFKQTISMLLKHDKVAETIELMVTQNKVFVKLNQNHDLHKSCLGIIVLHIHKDDIVGAKQKFESFLEYPSFHHSQEGVTAAELIQAYSNQDNENLKKILSRQLFNFLENQIALIVRSMATNIKVTPVSTSTSNTTTSTPYTFTKTSSANNLPGNNNTSSSNTTNNNSSNNNSGNNNSLNDIDNDEDEDNNL